MAITAAFGSLQHARAMGLTMAFLTIHELSMLWMALGTCKRRVLGRCLFQLIHSSLMAYCTSFLSGFHRISYLQRFMYGVATQAVSIGLTGKVGLMAHTAVRYQTVGCMAIRTSHFGMLALVGLQFPYDIPMAGCTTRIHSRTRHLFGRGMSIGMTLEAFGQTLTVSQTVTGIAFRNYIFVIDLSRSVRMELRVTVCTL